MGMKAWISAISILLVPLQGFASEEYTLQELLDYGIRYNKLLEAQRLETKAKVADVGPKSSLDDPMLSFEAMNYPVDSFSSREFGMTGRQLWFSQKIPFPGKLGAKEEAAKSEAERERSLEKGKELDVIRDIKILYYEIYLAHRRKSLLEKQQALIDKTLGVARSRYTTGKISQADVLNLQVEYGKLTEKVLEAERSIESLNAEIAHHLGGIKEFQSRKPAPVRKSVLVVKALKFDDLLSRALKANPSLHAMEHERVAREEEKRLAKKGYLPDFEFGAGYTFRDPSPGDPGTDFASVRVGINIPLWAGSKQSEEVKAASFREAKAEVMLNNERIHLERELKVTFSELKESDQRLELFDTSLVPLARQAAESSRAAYLSGKLDFASFLKAISSQFETELAREESLVQREKNIASLHALLGGELP